MQERKQWAAEFATIGIVSSDQGTTLTLADGFVYEGGWKEGEIHGKGTATYPNGDVYEGKFARGRQNGFGVMTYASGKVYEGEWVDGKRKDRITQ